ncbi:MAG: radical SAM protein [Deltaproteobacteria bacterium]|nr:radical SAM protein [Deltaproteobacteria bacterium]
MLIDLVFPPFDDSVLIPEIGVPVLTANLARSGHHVRQADLNVEFIRRHLSSLGSYSRPLGLLSLPPGGRRDVDPRAFLEDLAAALCRARALHVDHRGSLVELAKTTERSIGKTCQFGRLRPSPDWSGQMRGLDAPPALAALARHESEHEWFFRDLLGVVKHFGFAPASYASDDVFAAAREKNAFLEPFYEKRLAEMWSDGEPELFGVSIWSTSQLVPALVLARTVRSLLPSVRIVAGGAWCTYARRLIPEIDELFSYFDVFAVHEADGTLADLAAAYSSGSSAEGVRGAITRGASPSESDILRPPSPFDELELPVYDGFPIEDYPLQRLALRLFRGCYWSRCAFCTHACHPYTRRHSFGKTSTLSQTYLDRVREHVEHAGRTYGIRGFTIADNLIPPSVMKQLCALNVDAGLGIEWDSLARFEKEYTADFCRLLADGGCRQLDLGLETADDAALKRINKGINLATVVRNLKNLSAAGIRTKVFVLNYVGQPADEYERTLRFLREHEDVVSEVAISRFSLSRGTLPFRDPAGLGLAVDPSALHHLDVFSLPFTAEETSGEEEIVEITRRYFPRYW